MLIFEKIRSKARNSKLDLALLKSNQTLRKKYRVAVPNRFEVLAEEEDQRWAKFKVVITEAAVEQIRRVERKTKQKRVDEDILNLMEKGEKQKKKKERNTKHCIRKSVKKML